MKHSKKTFLWLVSLAGIGVAIWYWTDGLEFEADPRAADGGPTIGETLPSAKVEMASDEEVIGTPDLVLTEDVADEVAATRRMYMAHGPLRAPIVADPDSDTNKQILETMVLKALARSGNASAANN